MTPDELRALADALEPLASLERSGSQGALALESTIAYLRAQADAQPVAWSDGLGSFIAADEKVGDDPDILAYRVSLYTRPAPAVPKREPLSDEQIAEEATNRQMTAACEDAFYDGVRWAEHSHEIGGSDD